MVGPRGSYADGGFDVSRLSSRIRLPASASPQVRLKCFMEKHRETRFA